MKKKGEGGRWGVSHPRRSSFGAPTKTPIKQIITKKSVETVIPMAPEVSGIL